MASGALIWTRNQFAAHTSLIDIVSLCVWGIWRVKIEAIDLVWLLGALSVHLWTWGKSFCCWASRKKKGWGGVGGGGGGSGGLRGRRVNLLSDSTLFHLILFQCWLTHHPLIYERPFNIYEHQGVISQTVLKQFFIGFSTICNQTWQNHIQLFFFSTHLLVLTEFLSPCRAVFLPLCMFYTVNLILHVIL